MHTFARRLAVLALAVAVAPADSAMAGELRWRPGRSVMPATSTSATTARFTAPQRSAAGVEMVDPAVRPVAYEDADGPRLEVIGEPRVGLRSMVVGGGAAGESVRSAQVPSPDARFSTPDAQQHPEQLGTPLDDIPELPPMDMPPLDPQRPAEFERQPFMPPAEFEPTVRPEFEDPLTVDIPEPSPAMLEAERRRAEEACERGFADLQANTIDKLDISIAVEGEEGTDFPFECTLDEGSWHAGRAWPQTVYLWKAAALCHKPLYFEETQLERYGHSWAPCIQPFVSGAHFFSRLPVLPYCMGVEPPNECIYALGHYRPGSCAPYMCNPVPLSVRGGLIQSAAVTGAVLIIP